jgi:hypothetical protein
MRFFNVARDADCIIPATRPAIVHYGNPGQYFNPGAHAAGAPDDAVLIP